MDNNTELTAELEAKAKADRLRPQPLTPTKKLLISPENDSLHDSPTTNLNFDENARNYSKRSINGKDVEQTNSRRGLSIRDTNAQVEGTSIPKKLFLPSTQELDPHAPFSMEIDSESSTPAEYKRTSPLQRAISSPRKKSGIRTLIDKRDLAAGVELLSRRSPIKKPKRKTYRGKQSDSRKFRHIVLQSLCEVEAQTEEEGERRITTRARARESLRRVRTRHRSQYCDTKSGRA